MPFRDLLVVTAAVIAGTVPAAARNPAAADIDQINAQLQGRLLDFTHNHGADRRICSPALGEKRDVYVYLPPGYDGQKRFPVLIWLHGFAQDEKYFVRAASKIDQAIAAGRIPPLIVACPDGTTNNKPGLFSKESWFINSRLGRFEDFVVIDLWHFLNANFLVRPEREAHVLAGVSMGGASAFNLAIKHRHEFAVVAGIMPLLNPWYADCHGNHFAPFDPDCQGDKPYRPLARAGRYGPIPVRYNRALRPLYGNRVAVETLGRPENPAFMLDLYDVRPGELQMFIAYGGYDQFNGGAQAESFLYRARQRGLTAEVVVDPGGKHNRATAVGLFDSFEKWLQPLLAPYAPLP